MARPKSDDKRSAIMLAATHAIVAQGLGASTATIAKAAGISNGSLFTYFETKAALYNQLYFELKCEMGAAALQGFSSRAPLRDQLEGLWTRWAYWAMAHPEARRAMALLHVCDDVAPATHAALRQEMAPVVTLLEQVRANGPMKDVSLAYIGSMMSALIDTTMDFMLQDRENAGVHCKAGFEALWRMLN